MKLHKIYQIQIPTMYNAPCRIAVFTDGKTCKVFQKDFQNWWRNNSLERYGSVAAIERKLHEIEAEANRREAFRKQRMQSKH